MDKYTVDLDQVLNDFEYSELTDQYNNASARNPIGGTPSASQSSVTKHSINNVFHSLNEYLNTNINVNPLNQVDNNLLATKNSIEGPVLNANQDSFKQAEESIKDSNLKTDELLLDLSGEMGVNNKDINSENLVEKSDSRGSGKLENLVENGVCTSKTLEDNEEIKDKTIEAVEIKETVENNEEIEDKTIEAIKQTEETVEDNEEIEGKTIETVKQVEETVEGNEYLIDKQNEHFIEKEKVKDESVESESKIEEVPKMEVEESKDEDRHEVEPVIEEETKIGFSDDLDLDDNEINKLLEELEIEEMEISKETEIEPSQDGCENVNETEESQVEDDSLLKEMPVVESGSSLDDINKLEETQEGPNNRLDSNGNTKVKEETQEEVSNQLVLENKETDVEKSVRVESILAAGDFNREEKSEVKDDVIVNSDVDTLKKEELKSLDESDKEISTEEIVDEKMDSADSSLEIQKETSQDSLSRPQNLPLIGEGDEPKRKIDLIGDPGSTPYNNVYINKEIPRSKEKAYDSDTDYSTSSSPTFSDASTTASTVSIDEVRSEENKKPAATVNPEESTNKVEHMAIEPDKPIQATSEAEIPAPTESVLSESVDPTPEIENPTPETANPTSEETSEGNIDNNEASLGAGAQHVENIGEVNVNAISVGKQWLGKEAPLWIPDSDAMSCLHCDMKFTVLKRRHHCRACGLVLCSKCCHLRFRLEYLDAEARVCNKCHDILNRDTNSSSGSDLSPDQGNSPSYRPNPNNPLEYCSTVSPLQQAAGSNPNPPAVMVPVGVLKRKGSNKGKSNKSVMFCDGIRPGSDLTNLDNDFDYNNTKTKRSDKTGPAPPKINRNLPSIDPETNTFIPNSENGLPPTVTVCKTDISYAECSNNPNVVETLKEMELTFAIHVNLYVHLKIIDMTCCINKKAWCFSTEGLINVGQDEVVILLEYIDEESFVPKDVFYHINNVYNDAVKGNSVKEMGLSLHNKSNFLDSKNHAGFVYIRPTFQCLEKVLKPKDPYLIGILIHRWETPWAKLFPLRLVLRLGAEYRYYPSPIISTRHRESVFVEIGHTIINFLADFRNFSYTLPQIRGLTIHMEDKNTTITIPVNRYDQVMKSVNNSSDHILAFAGSFSMAADSHLVCIQDTQGNENCYSTHAINIHNKPRKITGASFIVFNGALKSSSGLTAKSNIVEDGLMIQVLPEHMLQIRESLRTMKNHTISCGCVNAASDETVNIVWGENDVNFNVGIISAIDNMSLSGVPSIRVHNGKNHVCVNGSRLIRWTEVFIIKSGDENPKSQDPVDVSRVSENIAKATCDALVKYLDLLVANGWQKLAIRTTLHVDNVSYLAGSNGSKLAPIYMKSLDDELIPVLHKITTHNLGDNSIVLELIFRILNV